MSRATASSSATNGKVSAWRGAARLRQHSRRHSEGRRRCLRSAALSGLPVGQGKDDKKHEEAGNPNGDPGASPRPFSIFELGEKGSVLSSCATHFERAVLAPS